MTPTTPRLGVSAETRDPRPIEFGKDWAGNFAASVRDDFVTGGRELLASLNDPDKIQHAIFASEQIALNTGAAMMDPENTLKYRANANHAAAILASLGSEANAKIRTAIWGSIQTVISQVAGAVAGAVIPGGGAVMDLAGVLIEAAKTAPPVDSIASPPNADALARAEARLAELTGENEALVKSGEEAEKTIGKLQDESERLITEGKVLAEKQAELDAAVELLTDPNGEVLAEDPFARLPELAEGESYVVREGAVYAVPDEIKSRVEADDLDWNPEAEGVRLVLMAPRITTDGEAA